MFPRRVSLGKPLLNWFELPLDLAAGPNIEDLPSDVHVGADSPQNVLQIG